MHAANVQLDEALELGLKLSAKDRIQLIILLLASIKRELPDDPSGEKNSPPSEVQ